MERLTKWNGKKWILPQGAWREIAERLAAYENTGLEPEEIAELCGVCDARQPMPHRDETISAVFVMRHGGGYTPPFDPSTGTALLTIAEVVDLSNNPDVLREPGANFLVIESHPLCWHISQVSGYTPETGLYTKFY